MAPSTETTKVCHISDLHLPLDVPFSPSWLPSKRCLGYANLAFSRGKTHKIEPFRSLLRSMAEEEADLVLLTGDNTNLALPAEYTRVNAELAAGGLSPGKTMVIPGNHDRYTPGADFSNTFERSMSQWLPPNFSRAEGYPIVRELGPITVIGLDTTIWRGPLRAAGRVSRDQMTRLSIVLDETRAQGAWPVIAMHHPPFTLDGPLFKNYRSGLSRLELFRETMSGRNATVLHGHLHKLLRRKDGGLDVIGITSASNDNGSATGQLAYHVYEFNRDGLAKGTVVQHWPEPHDCSRFTREPLPLPE